MKTPVVRRLRIMYLCLLVLICDEIKAQTESYDVMHYKSLSVCGVFLGAKKEILLKMFGKPDAIRTKTNEFDGTNYSEYVYGNSVFFVSRNVFEGFQLRDDIFQLDKVNLKVGDSIDKLRQTFPVSFKNRYEEMNETVVKVRIDATDSYILFHYGKNGIDDISTWDDL